MRTATRRTRTVRSRHHQRIRRYRRRRSRQPLVMVLATAAVLSVILLTVYLAAGRDSIVRPTAARRRCVESIGADRSGSQNAQGVIDRWFPEVDAIVGRAAQCKGLVFVESVYARPGDGDLRRISFAVDGVNRLDEEQKRRALLPKAKSAIQDVMREPAGGPTNLIGWFHSVERHLGDGPDRPIVNATLFTDGINSVSPVNMLSSDLSPAGVAALINDLQPDLPDCSGWRVRMLGVNSTSEGGVSPRLAQGAERFWRAFVEACGGTLVRYDVSARATE